VRAAGDIQLLGKITLNGTSIDADGGILDFNAGSTLTIGARVEAKGGSDSAGGDILLTAGGDILVNAVVEATGGNFDGGAIELDAGGDVLITDDISADSITGEGFGGTIDVLAGGSIDVVGGTKNNRLLLSSEGHSTIDGGDGGPQTWTAGGSIHFGEFVKLRLNGAIPDGFGEDLDVESGGDIIIEGVIESRGKGGQGGGGAVAVTAAGRLDIAASALITVSAGDGGAGSVDLISGADIIYDGNIDLAATAGGVAGMADLDAGMGISFSGTISSSGGGVGFAVGSVALRGCTIDILPGALVDNVAAGAVNTIEVSDALTILAGATVRADAAGTNTLRYRDPAVVPVVLGSVVPAPATVLTPTLRGCPLCGNTVVNQGETCDDGNVVSGDGCSADCQDEGCIADTPGYPGVPLCADGDGCTVDVCNTSTGRCEHSASCDDGIACTVDVCQVDTCIHTVDDLACSDGNPCTDESCSISSGCVIVANAALCDDGLFCNGADTCAGGQCASHSGDPCFGLPECLDYCDELLDECLAPFGVPCSSDGNPCSDDVCSGSGGCVHVNNLAQCDDGLFCNGNDFCRDGACVIHAGDPCLGGSECALSCVEPAAACQSPIGTPCSDEGNVCTDDQCDGSGACVHVANNAACDDGDLRTVTDVCSAGVCAASDGTRLSSGRLSATLRAGSAKDRFALLVVFPTAVLARLPSESGVAIELTGDDGNPVYGAFLPAANIVNSSGRGLVFRFRDAKSAVAEANGIVSAQIKRKPAKGWIKLKARMRGVEIGQLADLSNLSMSVLFGNDPASGDCASGRSYGCRSKGNGKVLCSG